MTITLYGRASSINVQKALWALDEVGRRFEHIQLGGAFGGLSDPAYRALNPNSRVPTLTDGDLVVWESYAIVRYVAAAYGAGTLWPADPRQRALADQWTDWTSATFQTAWLRVFEAVIRTPVAQHNPGLIAKARADADRLYGMLDAWLADREYLAGPTFTYADIVVGVSMFRWMTMPIERKSMPALEAWYRRLEARSAFQTRVCVSYAEMVGVPLPLPPE